MAHQQLTNQHHFIRLVATLATCLVTKTHAQAFPLVVAAADEIKTITIIGDREQQSPYQPGITTIGKLPQLLRDVPQSITVVTQSQLQDQAVQSIAEAVRYVPGVGIANGEGNRDSPYFRGVTNASGDFYIDGIRDDVEYYRDLYNIDRVEVLTGPNAMIFGRAGSGGIINRVTRQADWSSNREMRLTLGTYQNRRFTVDLAGPISQAAAFRVDGLYEDSGGFQKNFYLKRSGINPSLVFLIGERTLASISYEHVLDKRATDRGIPSYQGAPLSFPPSAFFGDPDASTRPTYVKVDSISSLIEHDFGNGVMLKNRTRYMDYDKFYQNYNAGAVNAAGTTVQISAYNNHQWRQNTFNQTDFNFTFNSGSIKHKMLAGMELGKQATNYLRKSGRFPTFGNVTTVTIPLANAANSLPVEYVLGATTADRDGQSKATVAALYVQDQIEFTSQVMAIVGIRQDRFKLDYRNNVTGLLVGSRDNLSSPRAGLVYKPVEQVSLYANYSVAYYPRGGDQLSSLTAVNQSFGPEKFSNDEVGAKWDLTSGLSARVAAYQLNRSNVAIADAVNVGQFLLVDGQRSKGVEFGISGNITHDWSIIGAYAHQSAKLTATASATALSGASIALVPANLVSLWNRYNINSMWGAGIGIIHSSEMFTSTSNAVRLPSFTRIDGAIYISLDKNAQLQINAENIADKKYYATANGDNNITPGVPRSYRVSANLRF